jgi:hypothetical protein
LEAVDSSTMRQSFKSPAKDQRDAGNDARNHYERHPYSSVELDGFLRGVEVTGRVARSSCRP